MTSTIERPPEASTRRWRTPALPYCAARRWAGSGSTCGSTIPTEVESPIWPTVEHEVAAAVLACTCRTWAPVTWATRTGTCAGPRPGEWAGATERTGTACGTAVLAKAPAAAAAVKETTSTEGIPTAAATRFLRRRLRPFRIRPSRAVRPTRSEGMRYLRSGGSVNEQLLAGNWPRTRRPNIARFAGKLLLARLPGAVGTARGTRRGGPVTVRCPPLLGRTPAGRGSIPPRRYSRQCWIWRRSLETAGLPVKPQVDPRRLLLRG